MLTAPNALSPRPAIRVLLVLLILSAGVHPAVGAPAPPNALGRPGYLVIEAARDSSAAFTWAAADDPSFRRLEWAEGRLTIPDDLPAEDFGRRDLGFPCTAALAGSGASGQLVLRDGIFKVSEPVVLVDGPLLLEIAGGELEVRGPMIRYRRSVPRSREFKSQLLLLAGMMLLVIVLLRRVRLKSDERAAQ